MGGPDLRKMGSKVNIWANGGRSRPRRSMMNLNENEDMTRVVDAFHNPDLGRPRQE
jgi:hypothetical protein